ncbi:MAG: B12-binding domain-containing radical SAM protein [Clostridiales bacterium]|nr:B12-binding domain-containing radical SAM protein [Clostridiales bacterium]MCI2161855.1 B12-binding domain-containing radical SAM protein [Oscillospiraceae bacterium]MCI1961929.1 B12-binding domain-containing radical SAM protein [Clostridiales bacterium]MCI2022338.1 B12-binding domain-containing radical SAM protein [Clostridiales bacterium]MCI2026735.1 B12-binding domain-containing radical SAM protein [Clostridiales bacterium]
MRYEGIVYRPPSEARSLIIQLTIGCARNTCTFCTMYKEKNFRIRKLEDVVNDLKESRNTYSYVRRIFLADGDALIVKTPDLLYILSEIRRLFPECERVTSYGAPADVLLKTPEELLQLRKAGLEMVYIGAESGDNEVLKNIRKGVTAEETVEACLKLKKAGIKVSMMLISGMGSRVRSKEHALASAKITSLIKPEYVSFLTLRVYPGTPLYDQVKNGEFQRMSPMELLDELKLFLKNVDSEGSVFRSNHASNYVDLGGNLNRDIPRMLAQIEEAQADHDFKPDFMRGL